jgi:signal transduction histidine kinase/ActR/RegA family two-component response regulator
MSSERPAPALASASDPKRYLTPETAALLRVIDRLVPPDLRETDIGERRRLRLTVVGCLFSFAIHAATFLAMTWQDMPIVAAGNGVSSILSLSLLIFLWRGFSIDFVANGLVAVLLFFVLGVAGPTGGDATSALHTAAILPGIAIMLVGRRAGAVWVVIVCVVMGALGLLRASGFEFPVRLDPERFAMSRFAGVMSLTLGISGMILLYEWVKDRALEDAAEARMHSEAAARENLRLESLMQENQKLESLGVLAGGVAHDFNNLLTPILGNAGLVASAESPNEAAEYAEQIVIAAEQAGDLTDQLLAYAGRGRAAPVPVDLSDSVRRVSSLIRTAVAPQVELVLSLTEEPSSVIGDPGQIQQIVLSLVTNASQALGGPGKIEVETGVLPEGMDPDVVAVLMPVPVGPCAVLTVSDNGQGMSADVRNRIFDPFFTTKTLGRGLGLSAVLGIVRSYNGTLIVTSEPGTGTRIEVLLPMAGSRPQTEINPPIEAPDHFTGEVLIVDDEPSIRRFASRALAAMGFMVHEAREGSDALTQLDVHPRIVAVLLDDAMPGMRGIEVLDELARRGRTLPIILSTGNPEGFALVRSDTPNVHWLSKPYSVDALRRAFSRALGRSREQQRAE